MSRRFTSSASRWHSQSDDMSNKDDDDVDCDIEADNEDAWSRREAARLKQIQIGKARPEYQRYVREVPPSRRRPSQPSTPDPRARVSKRQFDRALGDWRRRLHEFDAVPRNQRGVEHEACWSESDRSHWGSSSKIAGTGNNTSNETDFETASRSGYRRSRGFVAPRGDRSFGKFGPRKPALGDDEELEATESQAPFPPPAPPFSQPAELPQQQPAVRISLADQLMEMQFSTQVAAPACNSWPWYEEAQWSNVETPQKPWDMNFMTMEPMETPDKHLMACHGLMQQHVGYSTMYKACEEYMAMPAESTMIPHRLFDSSPEKSDRSTHSESTTVESSESLPNSNKADAPMSPSRPSKPNEMMDSSGIYLRSPVLSTPKRPYVPETPSPDRVHCSWMHQPMHFTQAAFPQAAMPWHLGVQAHEQIIPEFLQAMSYPDAGKMYS